jgi:hypothetical protein
MTIRIKPIVVSNYPDEFRDSIFKEERTRTELEETRNADFQESINDNTERRNIAEAEIQLKKDIFAVYLKKTFPDIVGNRKMTDTEVAKNEKLNTQKSNELKSATKKLHLKRSNRLSNEVKRKRKESEFRFANYEELYQTYFEDMMELGTHQKKMMNPETDGLNEVQRIIRDMDALELKLGRPVIPHRDIVESEESDFDSNTYTKPTDIFIRPTLVTDGASNIQKEVRLESARKQLNPNQKQKEFIFNRR